MQPLSLPMGILMDRDTCALIFLTDHEPTSDECEAAARQIARLVAAAPNN